MQKMKVTRTSRAVVLVFVFAEEKFLEHVWWPKIQGLLRHIKVRLIP